jgi:hypothetical protein
MIAILVMERDVRIDRRTFTVAMTMIVLTIEQRLVTQRTEAIFEHLSDDFPKLAEFLTGRLTHCHTIHRFCFRIGKLIKPVDSGDGSTCTHSLPGGGMIARSDSVADFR